MLDELHILIKAHSEGVSQVFTAAFGGFISILLKGTGRGVVKTTLGVVGSGFAGQCAAWLCHGLGVNQDLTMFFVALAGWLGAEKVLDFFEREVKKRISKKDEDQQ